MDIIQSDFQPLQQRNRVKSIVFRHCGNKELRGHRLADKNYQHPENAYLAKYSPKYYQSLSLLMKPCHSLLSRIKKIKKLKRFTGNFDDRRPQANWFKILANNRKEIEEFPRIFPSQAKRLFWKKASLCAVKFFFKIKKLQLPELQKGSRWELALWKIFAKYLRNLRSLKILEFDPHPSDYDGLKLFFKKLNGMTRLLGGLETLKFPLRSDVPSKILENKNVFSSLTHLDYVIITGGLSTKSRAIPKICENLRSFSFRMVDLPNKYLDDLFDRGSVFLEVPRIQAFCKLQSISIHWSAFFSRDIWSYFTPPVSLRNLNLLFDAQDMINMVLQCDLSALKDTSKYENFFDHWKEINELDALDLNIECIKAEERLFTRNFITAMLKKIPRLFSFTCHINLMYYDIWRFEPFDREEVPHLYEHLKKFQVRFDTYKSFVSFDFGFLKPFKNLNNIDFQGPLFSWASIGDAIQLLEGNSKSGEFSTLKLEKATIHSQEELRDLLKKISRAKKRSTNLKIILGVEFLAEVENHNEISYFEQFCEAIESETVKGLEISLEIRHQNHSNYTLEEVRRVLNEYPGMRNLKLKISSGNEKLEYIKRDGEKEELLVYPHDRYTYGDF